MDPDALRQMMEEHIPFNKFLGVKVAGLGEGFVRLEIPFRDELVGDPMRPALHGGVISTLADTAGGMAIWAGLSDPRARVSTIDLRIDYLRPGRLATLVAEANVVRIGNRVGVADVRLFHPDASSDTVATGKGVYNVKIVKPRPEASQR
ncbi:MAG: thioesterase family protein [Myxococcales bacterium]|nr:thioesterase family protein [Myxococcales bacterium]